MTIVVIGALGDLGARIVEGLRERGADVRGAARRAAPGCVVADLADAASLDVAFRDAARVFVQSSPTREQVRLETNAIEAAERAGVEQIVKLSNIPIPGFETGLHGNHRAIERRLAASPIASTVLQPSFFTSVIDKQRDLIASGRIALPTGAGRIAWIDPRDIAAVAVEALLRPVAALAGPLHLTGPEALDGDEVAARLGVRRIAPPLAQWRAAAVDAGLDPWLADSTVHLYEAVARGALAEVTDTVERVLGRPPRRAFSS
ncbi:MAG TPA: NAD(P)H-binding protein [Acidimicrobiia bacterium]|nr:NAD(P)H-binding protein [Acidimicrobiia bacterium]